MSQHIWCLFSVENNYDQPPNNLVAWWPTRPSLTELLEVFDLPPIQNMCDFDHLKQAALLAQIREQINVNVRIGETDYRLECVSPAKKL
jgi:hypothetical protein